MHVLLSAAAHVMAQVIRLFGASVCLGEVCVYDGACFWVGRVWVGRVFGWGPAPSSRDKGLTINYLHLGHGAGPRYFFTPAP